MTIERESAQVVLPGGPAGLYVRWANWVLEETGSRPDALTASDPSTLRLPDPLMEAIAEFVREAVRHVGFRARAEKDLVVDFGWPQENLLVESSDQWALDLVAYDRPRRDGGRRTLLAMEAKSHRRELEGLIDEMKRCRGLDPSQHRKWPTLKSPHRKCEGLLRLRYGLPTRC